MSGGQGAVGDGVFRTRPPRDALAFVTTGVDRALGSLDVAILRAAVLEFETGTRRMRRLRRRQLTDLWMLFDAELRATGESAAVESARTRLVSVATIGAAREPDVVALRTTARGERLLRDALDYTNREVHDPEEVPTRLNVAESELVATLDKFGLERAAPQRVPGLWSSWAARVRDRVDSRRYRAERQYWPAERVREVLTTLAEPPELQVSFLVAGSDEDSFADVDIVTLLVEEFDVAHQEVEGAVAESPASSAALDRVEQALRSPGLDCDLSSLRSSPGWRSVRLAAAEALRALRDDRLIPDAIPFSLIPVDLAALLEAVYGPVDQWPSIVLNQAEYDRMTDQWNRALPRDREGRTPSLVDVQRAIDTVYADYPEIRDALRRG